MTVQRKLKIVVVLLLMFPLKNFCQQHSPLSEQKNPHISSFLNALPVQLQRVKYFTVCLTGNERMAPASGNYLVLPANFYTSQLSFFCKKEFVFEKKTTIPLRLRLGSLAYTNKLEGKLISKY
ncbi:MAG: hypothetical protein C4308_06160 [Chitinophagaceae bacterium]